MNVNQKGITEQLKNNRIKNSGRNIVAAGITSTLSIVVPFFLRTVLVLTLGKEYLGLNSFYLSLVSVLRISELGIGSVFAYFLYQPAAINDRMKINAMLYTIKKVYRIIGVLILIVGVAATPFIRSLILSGLPDNVPLEGLFLIFVLDTALPYLFLQETVSLFEAFQRSDLNNLIFGIGYTVAYLLQFAALLYFSNYIFYVIALIVQDVSIILFRYFFKKRYFPDYNAEGRISPVEKKDLIKRAVSMLGHHLDANLLNSIDNVFISAFIGLGMVAVYGNYYYVIAALVLGFNVIYNAILPSIGNAIVTESTESNYTRFTSVFWLSACLSGWATACLICLFQDFMEMWMGKGMLLPFGCVIAFALYFYMFQIRKTGIMFKDAAGMWYNDRYKPYISVAVNLLLDIVLLKWIGVIGAIIASTVSISLVEFPWETKVLFRDYFHINYRDYMARMFRYTLINVIFIILCVWICDFIEFTGLAGFIVKGLVSTLTAVLFYYVVYHNNKEMCIWIDSFRLLKKSFKS